jgi:hypothetical protein
MDMLNLINKKKIIKKKLKEYTNKYNNVFINDYEDEEKNEKLSLIKMNIDELTKLLKVINLMIKNNNTIEDIIDFNEEYY